MAFKVLLVHGVGQSTDDLFGRDLHERIEEVAAGQPIKLAKLNWHDAVDSPTGHQSDSTYSRNHTAALMRGLIGFATLGARYAVLSRLLDLLLVPAPIVIWAGLALGLRWLAGVLSTPQVADRVDYSMGHALSDFVLVASNTFAWFVPTARTGRLYLAVYAYGIALLASTAALALWLYWREGFWSTCRAVLVPLLRPPVFVVSIARRPALLFLVAVFAVTSAIVHFDPAAVSPARLSPAATGEATIVATSPPHGTKVMLLQLALLAGFAVAMVPARWLTRQLVAPLKIVGDVACFLGDRAYADRLLDLVTEHVEGLAVSQDDRLVLVGHSLGSVVLAQWLVRRAHIMTNASVVLITMSSPLRRFACRTCSDPAYTPEFVIGCASRRFGDFRWLNIYRPFDPIGTRLFARAASGAMDVSTDQHRRLFMAAHTNYWDDPSVLAIAASFLRDAAVASADEYRSPFQLRAHDAADEGPASAVRFHETLSVAAPLFAVTALVACAARVTVLLLAPVPPELGSPEHRAYVATHGVNTSGRLYRYSTADFVGAVDAQGNPVLSPIGRLLVRFDAAGGPVAYTVDGQPWVVGAFDGTRERGAETIVQKGTFFGGTTYRADSVPVTVRAIPGRDQFDIPDLPLYRPSLIQQLYLRVTGFALNAVAFLALAIWIAYLSYDAFLSFCGVHQVSSSSTEPDHDVEPLPRPTVSTHAEGMVGDARRQPPAAGA